MRLWLLRHGEAGPGVPDAQRSLTARGRADVLSVARQWQVEQPQPVQVWVSPLLRAQQTWQIVQQALSIQAPVRTEPALVPEADPVLLLALLAEQHEDTLLVGHNPLLSDLLSLLVEGFSRAGRVPVMGTSHLVGLSGSLPEAGVLRLETVLRPEPA